MSRYTSFIIGEAATTITAQTASFSISLTMSNARANSASPDDPGTLALLSVDETINGLPVTNHMDRNLVTSEDELAGNGDGIAILFDDLWVSQDDDEVETL